MKVPAALSLTFAMLSACAATPGYPPGATAIYSPPVRLGGTGSVIRLPAPATADPRSTALETPDRIVTAATRDWLVGVWIPDAARDDRARLACNSGVPVAYNADGTIATFDYVGRWMLEGDTLVERITELSDSADPSDYGDLSQATRTRIRRVGPDEMAHRADGRWVRMLRCRQGDIRTE